MPAPLSYALGQALGAGGTNPVQEKAAAARAALDQLFQRGDALGGVTRAEQPAATQTGGSDATSLISAGPGSATGAIGAAQRFLGMPYRWGGNGNGGIDCSGLVQQAFRSIGVNLPRTAAQQSRVGSVVGSLAQARPGDLVFFGNPASPHHVGIYVGNGQMIDANHTGGSVGVRSLYRDLSGIRRIG